MVQIGEELNGRYKILDNIGAGAQSVVYRAKHMNLDKDVVVKEIKRNNAIDDGVLNSSPLEYVG